MLLGKFVDFNCKFVLLNLLFTFFVITFAKNLNRPKFGMKDQNVATRLKLFMESEGLSHSQFADACSIPRPTLSQLLSGRNKKISDLLVGQIHQAFPGLSVLWLLFGEGDMMTNTGGSPSAAFDPIADDSIFAGNSSELDLDAKETALETPVNASAIRMNKEKSTVLGYPSTDLQKIQNGQNPRKVIQITVYYDDSTFETFYPETKK
jgi:putative DNA-binding protein